jgi:hypothetical protein
MSKTQNNLIPIPVEKEYWPEWVEDQIDAKNTAVMGIRKDVTKVEKTKVAKKIEETRNRSHEKEILEWQGPNEAIIVIGHPYITSRKTRVPDEDGNMVANFEYTMLDVGVPLHQLFWSNKYHGFVCVRADVYEI